jgi:HD superfamily phosphohydrolase
MSTGWMEEKVFKDPIHKYIYVQDELVWNLINTKEFQRLRRIRQLGTSYFTFHGAEHSRFSHSLGVYEIVRRIISQFERNQYADWPKEERLLCLCAALLHDIGHGPFSHSIEKAVGCFHEDWSCKIVLGDTEVNQVLSLVDPAFPEKVASVIKKTYEKEIVVSLISSQLDADRMDYLLRDAYFTGVNYGTFDIDRIQRVLRPYKGRLVVKESGMHAVEDYLMSRYQMYWQVYFHPVTRSSEIILRKVFQRAKDLHQRHYVFSFMMKPLERLLENCCSIDDYLWLDEAFLQMAMMQWTQEKDEILADLCDRFMHRKLFKYVTLDELNEQQEAMIREALVKVGLNPEYYMEIDFPTDLPYDIYRPGASEEKLPILLLSEKDQLIEFSEQSEIVRSLSRIQQGTYQLYIPLDRLEQNSDKLSQQVKLFLGLPV